MSNITDTYNTELTAIMRQVLASDITLVQARQHIERAKRISQCARYGVSVAELKDRDLKRMCRKLGVEL